MPWRKVLVEKSGFGERSVQGGWEKRFSYIVKWPRGTGGRTEGCPVQGMQKICRAREQTIETGNPPPKTRGIKSGKNVRPKGK